MCVNSAYVIYFFWADDDRLTDPRTHGPTDRQRPTETDRPTDLPTDDDAHDVEVEQDDEAVIMTVDFRLDSLPSLFRDTQADPTCHAVSEATSDELSPRTSVAQRGSWNSTGVP